MTTEYAKSKRERNMTGAAPAGTRAPGGEEAGRYFITAHPELREEPFALSDMQQAYWIGRDTSLEGGGVAMQGYMEIDCPSLDVRRFEKAFERLIERHEMLRAVVLEDGRQKVLPLPLRFSIRQEDVSGLPQNMQEERLDAIAEEMCAAVSDLRIWPQSEIRFSLVSPDGRGYLHLRFDQWSIDGRSFQILLEELLTFYHDPDATLPALHITFQDYMLALDDHMKSDEYRKSEEYWRKRLKTLPPAPQLPRREATGNVRLNGTVTRRIESLTEEQTEAFTRACAMRGLSMPSVLGAAYGELLAFWSGSDRFTLNVPRFNRNLHWHPDINSIVGEFATFTLLEYNSRAGETFREKAEAFQKESWESMEYGHVSGMYLLRELAREKGRLDPELMPVVFTALPSRKAGDTRFEDLFSKLGTIKRMHGSTPQTRLDCIFTVFDNKLHIYWDSRDDAFPLNMAEDMFKEMMRIVRVLATDDGAWERTGLASVPERQMQLRNTLNQKAQALPDCTVIDLFVSQAAKTPDNAALITHDERVTYSQLYAAVRDIAARLTDLVGPLSAVEGLYPSIAVLLPKSWQAVAAALAIQAVGLPYLPLDPSLPPARLETCLGIGKAVAIVCERSLAPVAEIAALPALFMEDWRIEPLTGGKETEPTFSLSQGANTAAYVMLTSGTTGIPKAVTIGHKGLMNVILYSNERFNITPEDRFIAVTALHHDMSLYDIFGALTTGAALVIPSPDAALDPDAWIELITRENVTIWNSVPGFHVSLLERCLEQGVRLPLRIQMLGGDWISKDTLEKIHSVSPGSTLISLGGPTETTVWNIMHEVEECGVDWPSIPYGTPIPNNAYHILDEKLRDVPNWVPGEMYCSGIGLCLHTSGDGVENTLFATHPETGERLYRTGDIGRFHEDGLIEILGRKDFQLNIGGYRFNPGEVETRLAGFQGITRAILAPVRVSNTTTGTAYSSGGEVLGAYLATNGSRPSEQTLTSFLMLYFPLTMVPRLWVFGEELPLTANGKVDRSMVSSLLSEALRTHAVQQNEAERRAGTDLEKMIFTIWEDILKTELPGMRANFFRHGGDSLKATQVLNRIKARIPIELPITVFFTTPTPEGLVSAVLSSVAEKTGAHRSLHV